MATGLEIESQLRVKVREYVCAIHLSFGMSTNECQRDLCAAAVVFYFGADGQLTPRHQAHSRAVVVVSSLVQRAD